MHKLFIYWNCDGDGYHRVELELEGKVVQYSGAYVNQPDRLTGYCQGVVDTYRRLGIDISMPQCLQQAKDTIPRTKTRQS